MRLAFRTPWRRATPLSGLGSVRTRSTTPVNCLHSAACRGGYGNLKLLSSSRTPGSRIATPTSKCHYSSGTTGTGQARSNGNGNKTLKYAVVGGVLGAGTIFYWDDIQHLYRAASRTGRVVGALAVCINEWVPPSLPFGLGGRTMMLLTWYVVLLVIELRLRKRRRHLKSIVSLSMRVTNVARSGPCGCWRRTGRFLSNWDSI